MINQRRYDVNFPEISEELAYICGFLLGDGSIQVRMYKHDYAIKAVGNPRDERSYYDILIKRLFLELFNIPITTQLHDRKTTYGFQFSCKQLALHLIYTYGIPQSPKYKYLSIPTQFYEDETLLRACIRGIFDTDGCVCFKKGSKGYPYYPVVSISSKSARFMFEIVTILEAFGITGKANYDYKVKDKRIKKGHTIISNIELTGYERLDKWIKEIGTWHPKHQGKILSYGKEHTKLLLWNKIKKNIAGGGIS